MAEIIAQLFPFARVDRPRLVVTSFGNATKIFPSRTESNCSYLEEEDQADGEGRLRLSLCKRPD